MIHTNAPFGSEAVRERFARPYKKALRKYEGEAIARQMERLEDDLHKANAQIVLLTRMLGALQCKTAVEVERELGAVANLYSADNNRAVTREGTRWHFDIRLPF